VAEGALYFFWVIPYGIASAMLALLYFRFVWQLPNLTRARFIAADRSGYDSVSNTLLYWIEEVLEMFGIVLFLYALLAHLAEETGGLVLRISPDES